MPIVGGLGIHRKQITVDYLETATGQVRRGQCRRSRELQDRRHPAAIKGQGADSSTP
jgi:hypothetical protein